jgi:hypothetical protein
LVSVRTSTQTKSKKRKKIRKKTKQKQKNKRCCCCYIHDEAKEERKRQRMNKSPVRPAKKIKRPVGTQSRVVERLTSSTYLDLFWKEREREKINK